VHLPEALTDRLPVFQTLKSDWDPIPRWALFAWTGFYLLFLYQLARGTGFLLLMDGVFVPIHEGGHLLFRFFGEFLNIVGGTLLQLGVPVALAIYFLFQRQAQGVAFCMFFFFEQFLPIAAYMADARAQDLPLLTIGESDYVIHDWNYLFGKFGVLPHDVQIAATVRFIGWLGMLSVAGWLIWRGLNDSARSKQALPR
jgi:hypothetical protein